MTYSFVVDVPMPIELYRAVHEAIQEAAGDTDYGMMRTHRPRDGHRFPDHRGLAVKGALRQIRRRSGDPGDHPDQRRSADAGNPPREEFAALGLIVRSARISI